MGMELNSDNNFIILSEDINVRKPVLITVDSEFKSTPPGIDPVDDLDLQDGKLFNCTRQTVWKYGKEAGIIAGLNIAEEQKEKSIKGIWTHIFRKSYSKFMQSKGATRGLRMCKLRHTFKDAHDAYDAADINALRIWEKNAFE